MGSKKNSPKYKMMKFFSSIVFVLILIIGIIGSSYFIGHKMITVYTPLIDAAMEIKLKATTAHLWFEEIISGDRNEDMDQVWEHIDQADWYANAMLVGGKNNEGTFIPLEDTALSNEIKEVKIKIEEFRKITIERYLIIEQAQAGTDIDEKYDAVFRDFVIQADEVETKLQLIMTEHLSQYNKLQVGLIILVLIISIALIFIFKHFEKIQRKDYFSILDINTTLKHEIHERQKAELQSKENELKYKNLIKFIPIPVGLVNKKGKLLYINERFTKTFGYTLSDIPTLNDWWSKAYPDKAYRSWVFDKWNKSVEKAEANNSDIEAAEFRITSKKGKERIIIISGIIINNDYLATFLDITERKKAKKLNKSLKENLETIVQERTRELDDKALKLGKSQQALAYLLEDVNDIKKQLEHSNSKLVEVNKEMEAFSYSVSHDLKAPLRAVIGFSQILKEDFDQQLDPESKRYIGLIKDNAENMGVLINDLLNFSRMGRTKLQKSELDLHSIVQRVAKELEPSFKNRELSIEINRMPLVNADEKLIYHVLLNLLSNAIKFTSKLENAKIEVGYIEKEHKNIFFVKDNGVGFNMKYANKIFDVFQRLHTAEEFPGTGIGLSIVQRIIYKHEGRIWVESEIDKGTTFFFTL